MSRTGTPIRNVRVLDHGVAVTELVLRLAGGHFRQPDDPNGQLDHSSRSDDAHSRRGGGRELLGLRGNDQPLVRIANRFLPFIWWPLPVLLVTGAVLIVAEPARALQNPVFLLKMVLLLGAAGVTLACQIPLRKDPVFWEASTARRRVAQLIAATSLPLWVAVICAGRWIAYVQGT
jgi:hypothetical protein